MHDKIEQLKQELKDREKEISMNLDEHLEDRRKFYTEIQRLEDENEKLKEALRMCNMFDRNGFCGFCKNKHSFEHLKDCEYVRLSKWNEVFIWIWEDGYYGNIYNKESSKSFIWRNS